MQIGKATISLGLLALIITLSSFSISKTKEDEPQWKNLQVLPTNLTKDQIDEIMDAWSSSLGVSCENCHMEGNPSADDKEDKKIARKMMTMTNEINENYFGKNTGTIGCMTCHNGKIHP